MTAPGALAETLPHELHSGERPFQSTSALKRKSFVLSLEKY